VECDKGPHWAIRKPLSFLNIIEGIPHKLQPIIDEFSLKTTYLLSPEVLANSECLKLFQSLQNQNELAAHMHGEFVEPLANWNADRTDAFQIDFSPLIEYQKIHSLTELFEKKLGFRPTSFRAGRFGLSRYTLRFLDKLGYFVDSSVTPFTWWWRRKGKGVNFLGAPYQPYFPSFNDFRKRGKMKILEVPIGIVNPFWAKWPSPILRRINPLNRIQTILLSTFLGKRIKSIWLRPTFSTVHQMIFVTHWIIKSVRSRTPILNMMFHSNEIMAGMSPYNQSEDEVKNFLKKLREYFTFLLSKFEVQSIALSETVKIIGSSDFSVGPRVI